MKQASGIVERGIEVSRVALCGGDEIPLLMWSAVSKRSQLSVPVRAMIAVWLNDYIKS